MKPTIPDPTLSILLVCLSLGLLLRWPWSVGPPPASWRPPPETALEAEHLLARGECLPSRLLRDARTVHLLPIVSPALTNLLVNEATRRPFEHRSDEELIALLESVSGIGPKKAARLRPFICSREHQVSK